MTAGQLALFTPRPDDATARATARSLRSFVDLITSLPGDLLGAPGALAIAAVDDLRALQARHPHLHL